jgi:hypothetical protein
MGTSPSRVARIEAGEPPGAEVRKRLAVALSMEPDAPGLDPALITPRVGVALVAAIVAALWLSTIVLDAHLVRLGVAAAIAAALWLSTVMERRGTSARVPAMVVAALWLSVIAVGLLSNGGRPLISNGRDTGIEAASAAYGAVLAAPHGAVLGAIASSGDEETGEEASAAPEAANLSRQAAALSHRLAGLSHQLGRCGSRGSAGGQPKVLASGIDPFPWTGALVIHSGSGACDLRSRITLAGVRSIAAGDGLDADSRQSPPATPYQEVSSTVEAGGAGAGQGGAADGNHSASNTIAHGNGGNGPIGNTVSSLGATVGSIGNTVNSVGQALRKP